MAGRDDLVEQLQSEYRRFRELHQQTKDLALQEVLRQFSEQYRGVAERLQAADSPEDYADIVRALDREVVVFQHARHVPNRFANYYAEAARFLGGVAFKVLDLAERR